MWFMRRNKLYVHMCNNEIYAVFKLLACLVIHVEDFGPSADIG
jgi:hypothetical protein